MAQIKAEEDYANYPIPKFCEFDSEDSKERILYANFERIDQEVNTMIKVVLTEFKKEDGAQTSHKKSSRKSSK